MVNYTLTVVVIIIFILMISLYLEKKMIFRSWIGKRRLKQILLSNRNVNDFISDKNIRYVISQDLLYGILTKKFIGELLNLGAKMSNIRELLSSVSIYGDVFPILISYGPEHARQKNLSLTKNRYVLSIFNEEINKFFKINLLLIDGPDVVKKNTYNYFKLLPICHLDEF